MQTELHVASDIISNFTGWMEVSSGHKVPCQTYPLFRKRLICYWRDWDLFPPLCCCIQYRNKWREMSWSLFIHSIIFFTRLFLSSWSRMLHWRKYKTASRPLGLFPHLLLICDHQCPGWAWREVAVLKSFKACQWCESLFDFPAGFGVVVVCSLCWSFFSSLVFMFSLSSWCY